MWNVASFLSWNKTVHKIIYLYPHRTLRGVYEHTGGRNLALMAALENTLEEALKVEKDRRLTILDGINKPNKPDYFSPQYERGKFVKWL